MLRAGALFYAIVISLILALVSSSLVMYGYLNRYRNLQYDLITRLHDNANSGIQLLMSDQDIVDRDDEKQIDLFDLGRDSVLLKRKSWGVFKVITATATSKNQLASKSALMGYSLNDRSTALYLADNNKPLSICGSVKIVGTAYLPKAGTKRAYIEGKTFTGRSLVDGTVLRSKRSVPRMNKEVLRTVTQYINGSISFGRPITMDELGQDTLSQSFADETIIWQVSGSISLSEITLIGNIMVMSSTSIFVSKSTRLKDVIIAAPLIEIEAGFAGTLQAFSSEELIVGENVELFYPTVLGMVANQSVIGGKAQLIIEQGARIKGVVFAASQSTQVVAVKVERGAKITGQVYSQDGMQLRGEVIGSVICDKFILKTASAYYENHLLDGRIDITQLAPQFAGIGMLGISENKSIAKWVH